ncbi:MAG: Ig-like domain-containing protein [Gaiellales bacterium]
MRGRMRFVLVLAVLLASGAVVVADASAAPLTFAISDDAAQRAFPSELTSAKAIGIGAARAYVGWADVATRRPVHPRDPADPAYDWAQADADMARYQAAGLAVWIAFWRTPSWASGTANPAAWATNPQDLEDFAFAVATRYPQVDVFIDWNEPNVTMYATPNTIAAYEPMARAVYAGVKAAHPGAEVIAGNLARYRDNGRDPVLWATALRADQVPMDAFGIHPYPDVDEPLADRSPRTRIDLFDVPALARIVGVPVAVTEFGWSSQLAGLANQASWTAQAIDVARCTPGLSQFVFWGFHDHPVPAGQTPDPWVTYGWLDATGAAKPVYTAAAAALAGTPDCTTIGEASGAPAGWPATSTIPPPDSAPVCSDAALSVVAGGSASADLGCTDADGDSLGYVVSAPPVNGTLAHAGSLFTYAPNAGFAGTDTFAVAVHDGVDVTAFTVTVSVSAPVADPVVTPPVAELVADPLVADPLVVLPAVAPPPAAAAPPALPRLRGRLSYARGVASIPLACDGVGASCVATVRLSATVRGVRRMLGTRTVSLGAGTSRTFRLSLRSSGRKALRAVAGTTVSLRVGLTTDGNGMRATTTTARLRVIANV